MPYIATQTIASGYGTYHAGDQIDDDLPEPVRDAWEAARLVEAAPDGYGADVVAAADPPETAEKPKAAPRRKPAETAEGPQRRISEKATAPAQRRLAAADAE